MPVRLPAQAAHRKAVADALLTSIGERVEADICRRFLDHRLPRTRAWIAGDVARPRSRRHPATDRPAQAVAEAAASRWARLRRAPMRLRVAWRPNTRAAAPGRRLHHKREHPAGSGAAAGLPQRPVLGSCAAPPQPWEPDQQPLNRRHPCWQPHRGCDLPAMWAADHSPIFS